LFSIGYILLFKSLLLIISPFFEEINFYKGYFF